MQPYSDKYLTNYLTAIGQPQQIPNATQGQIAYSNWYNNAKKIIVSETMRKENLNNTIVISENIPDEISKMKQQAGKNILIFGSPSVSQLLMQHNLIDNYWIFINPVVFGKSIPLFADSTNQTIHKCHQE